MVMDPGIAHLSATWWASSQLGRPAGAISFGSMPAAAGTTASGRTLPAGQVRAFGAGYVHDVVNVWTEPAVSVHAYSPPLTVMRRYELTAGGLARSAIEYSELTW